VSDGLMVFQGWIVERGALFTRVWGAVEGPSQGGARGFYETWLPAATVVK
jgi:hypothetical protein